MKQFKLVVFWSFEFEWSNLAEPQETRAGKSIRKRVNRRWNLEVTVEFLFENSSTGKYHSSINEYCI